MKIAIPVLPAIGAYISDDARSCINDDCFDLLAFSNRKFQSGKKSDFGDFASSSAKMTCLHRRVQRTFSLIVRLTHIRAATVFFFFSATIMGCIRIPPGGGGT